MAVLSVVGRAAAPSLPLRLARLRSLPTPVIGRIHEDQVWLDMRGAAPFDELLQTLGQLG